MCRYYSTRYECGHRHCILELEPNCYLIDPQGDCYGCCEKEEYARYAKRDVPSPFPCPDCQNYNLPNNGDRPADDILVTAANKNHQKVAEETEKKATRAMGKAFERGMVWKKFRARENPAARNLDGDWRVKKNSAKQIAPALTAREGTAGENITMDTKTQAEPEPEKSACMVYGAVTISKRK